MMGDRLLVIGGDAAGMAAAAQVRRRAPDMEIVALEKDRWTSYSACGIPYVIGGSVPGIEDLVARTPEEFRAMRIDMRTEHEVIGLDLAARKVEVHNRAHGRTFQLGFDLLHVATGALPRRPDLPGISLSHVHGVQTLGDAASLLAGLKAPRPRPRHVVVIGSGYIGLEMAEAFVERGSSVTVIEAADEVMDTLDPDMGALVARAMRDLGITVRTGEAVEAISDTAVHTPTGEIPADLVILGLGVTPNSALAAAAGVETGVRDAIVVDRQQRSSVPGVWAAGDCCQCVHVVSGRPVYQALGTVANKQGRVAGINISGGYATFSGVAGTAVTRICQLEIGRTGLSEREAIEAGFSFVTAKITTTTHAGYMPDAAPLTVKLLAERGQGRILGAQVLGGRGAAKRVDVVAATLTSGGTAEDLLGMDLGYAPPFSSVWDPLQLAARQAVAELA
jgi:NADPH-dependent 2,4-dienoyl-CoA reductase/sulfur reductase-like enzyme